MRVDCKSLVVLSLAVTVPATAGTVRGRVEVIEKGGKQASDPDDAVVWVEGPKVKPARRARRSR